MRKKKHEEHENHERWLVSYADFITLLFAFFTVLYATAQTDQAKLTAVVDALNAAFDGGMPDATVSSRTQGTTNIGLTETHQTMQTDTVSVVESIKRGLKGSLSDNVVQIGMVNQTLVVALPEQLAFAAGSADLNPAAFDTLGRIAEVVAPVEAIVEISGQADGTPLRPGSPFGDNWGLAAARATAVARHLERRGVSRDKLVASASVVVREESEARSVTLRIRAAAPSTGRDLTFQLDREGLLGEGETAERRR